VIVLANALGIIWSGYDQLAPSNYRSLFQNIGLVCRALMQKRPVVVRSLLIVATPYCQTSRTSALRIIVMRLCSKDDSDEIVDDSDEIVDDSDEIVF